MLVLQGSAGQYICLPESPCTEMVLDNVNISGGQGLVDSGTDAVAAHSAVGFQCQDAYGSMENVSPAGCLQSSEGL